jgi:CheY-like chemotaxis protein
MTALMKAYALMIDEKDKADNAQWFGSRFVRFQDLMRNRIHDILLVSSLYDSFILGEDGPLYEMMINEYIGLNLSHTPGLTRVSSGKAAIEQISRDGRFDLIITTLHLEDMHALGFARELRRLGNRTPLVLLTYDNRELNDLIANHDISCFDKVFMWQGNFRILLAITKCIEDILNVEPDTKLIGVQSIILIEDNVKFYSSYLPIIYTELMHHSQNVISEGVNLAHKLLRMRARPKILLCTTYEEAWEYYEKYHETILGVISDVCFPKNRRSHPFAGLEFARAVKKTHPDTPILLQSDGAENEQFAVDVGASFLLKNSPLLLEHLRQFMKQNFSFGDFIFRMPDSTEVGRAADLREMMEMLRTIPDECLLFHVERNHFSNWLKARTEFLLAHQLRPRQAADYASVADLRRGLLAYMHEYHAARQRGAIVDFDPAGFDAEDSFARIGGGSLGGKGRGLAFANALIYSNRMRNLLEGIQISVPPSVILGSDVFDLFLDENGLRDFAIGCDDDQQITERFLQAPFPSEVTEKLRQYLEVAHYPLAVRSSSLLEDSQYQPFAGVYATYMIPSNYDSLEARLTELSAAIKRVYASTFSGHAKAYIRATPYRLEEEKMAVVIQKLVGQTHNGRFYPDFSGVARSHNYYPIAPMVSDDGIALVALGLGSMVVEGGKAIRFCPRYPRHLVQFATVDDALNYSQKEFYALELPDPAGPACLDREPVLARLELRAAEDDDVLGLVGSTYSPENNSISDGISRSGIRIVTFAPILKDSLFPLADILHHILEMGRRGMSTPIEIEFSVNMSAGPGQPREFRLLQMRPMVLRHEQEALSLGNIAPQRIVCQSRQVLGNGVINSIYNLVVVDKNKFERAKSVEVAREVRMFNVELLSEGSPYLLIGVGRWGSADPWLGIPVNWDEISGARVIVEAGFKDMKVEPSQGTHFFQNLTAFEVGYFTVNSDDNYDLIDWDWLAAQPAAGEREYTRHIRLSRPITVRMNGHNNEGVIIKPE